MKIRVTKLIVIISLIILIFTACSTKKDTSSENLVPNEGDSHEQQLEELEEKSTEPLILEPELPGAFFVMIDNHPKARPQSNLDKADLVYEMICEGTFTRYLAGFYNTDPVIVGPVRSARYYYAQIAHAYDTVVAHIGGNMDALAYLKNNKLKTMCDITTASGYFERNSSRKMPHNAYVKSSEIIRFAQNKNYVLSALPELNTGELSGDDLAFEVSIDYGTSQYPHLVGWEYEQKENRYVRHLNSSVFLTAEKKEVYADNIILIEAPIKTVQVPVDGVQSEVNIIGSGDAYFLRDGLIFKGSWKKESANSHFNYYLEDSSDYTFKDGNVWVQHVASFSKDLSIIYNNSEE